MLDVRRGSVAAGVATIILLWAGGNDWRFAVRAAESRPARPGSRPPNVRLFDMGSATSPLWAGFTRVTPQTVYDPKRGFGWVESPVRPKAYTADYLDALGCDHVNAPQEATLQFRQDLPNGRYVIWVLSGSHVSLNYLLRPHGLRLQGKEVLTIEPSREEVFRAVKYEWSKGDDIYDHFIKPRFRWLRHQATVSDGKLIVGFTHSRNFPVCALVVAEAAVADRVQVEIDRIEQRRRAAFYDIWNAAAPKEAKLDSATSEDRRRGYLVAAVNYLDDVFPWSEPPAGASRHQIDMFATPGEQEQASFCVYGLTDLRHVDFAVTDLRSAEGGVVPSSVIERGLVQFAPRRIGHGPHFDIYPTLILPARATFVGRNTCKQFWITVRVPSKTPAGIYEGSIRISSLDAPSVRLKLRLRVLPFELLEPPVERYLYFGTMLYHARSLMPEFDEAKYWQSVRAEARFLRDNEFCIAQCLINRWGNYLKKKDGRIIDVDVSPTEKILQICRQEGCLPRDNTMVCLTGALNIDCGGYWRQSQKQRGIKFAPTPEGRANFIRAVKIIDQKGKKAGWPDIAFECGGEYQNYREQGAAFAVAVHSAFKEAGVLNTLRGNGAADMAAISKGLVAFPEPNWALMNSRDLPVIKANAQRLWFYNFSQGRFGYGWWCFKHGATRASHEVGIYFHGQPGNIFDNVYGDFALALPTSLTSFAPTVRLKRIVEGADDYKYLHTLDTLIKRAAKSDNGPARKAAAAAKKWFDQKLAAIPDAVDGPVDRPELPGEIGQAVSWTAGDMDKYRRQAAEHIIALHDALGEQR